MENKKINNSVSAGQELKKLDEPTPLKDMVNDNKVLKASTVVGYSQNLKEAAKYRPYTITGACTYAVHPSFDREKIINEMKMEMLGKLKPLIDLFVVEPIMIGKTNLKGTLTVYLTEEQINRLKESHGYEENE